MGGNSQVKVTRNIYYMEQELNYLVSFIGIKAAAKKLDIARAELNLHSGVLILKKKEKQKTKIN